MTWRNEFEQEELAALDQIFLCVSDEPCDVRFEEYMIFKLICELEKRDNEKRENRIMCCGGPEREFPTIRWSGEEPVIELDDKECDCGGCKCNDGR